MSKFTIKLGRNTIGCDSLADCVKAFEEYSYDFGSRDLRRGDGNIYRNGKQVAHVSYNGRVWREDQFRSCYGIADLSLLYDRWIKRNRLPMRSVEYLVRNCDLTLTQREWLGHYTAKEYKLNAR